MFWRFSITADSVSSDSQATGHSSLLAPSPSRPIPSGRPITRRKLALFSSLISPFRVLTANHSWTITLAPKKLIRTRRASEGSASEPSLARRVSMCKDAKLSCRGNNAKANLASFWRFSRHFLVSNAFPSVHSPLATTPASRWAPSLHWPLAATRRLCHRQFTGLWGAGHRRGDAKHHPRSPDILSLRQCCPSLASVSGSWLSSMAQARSLWARSA